MDRERLRRESFESGVEFEKLREEVHHLRGEIERFGRLLHRLFGPHDVTDFELFQILGGTPTMINGTVVGTTSTFKIGLVPNTNFIPLTSGPAVAVDDSTVTLGTDANGNPTATVPETSTATSYNLTITGVSGKGVPLTHTFSVPIIAAPPVLTDVTDFTLDQLS